MALSLRGWREGVDYVKDVPGCPSCNVPTLTGVEVVIARILQLATTVAGLVAFLYLIWGGFLWLTAGDDDQKISQAKNTITYAFVGLLMLVGSLIVIKAIEEVTGVELTKFRIFFLP